MPGAVCPVEQQLDAYNAHDVDRFIACYRDPSVFTGHDGATAERDHAWLRASYAALFARYPDLHCDVPTRIRAGSWVVDEEVLSGVDDEPVHAIAVYRVEDGLIAEFRALP